ncbi:MAG: hypothetical protein KF908_08175 [Nitrosomonas sp.]|nr:hypothetical protein [Nitrosomonas sp.]MCW5608630.1 hypothetical protein [Nitrosomonas sp.]
MNKSFFQKKKRIPLFLVAKIRKRHVPPIYKDHEIEWKLFAEGALRNWVFHDAVMHRGNKCLACRQSTDHRQDKISPYREAPPLLFAAVYRYYPAGRFRRYLPGSSKN